MRTILTIGLIWLAYEILWGLVGNASNYSDILGKEMKKLKDTMWEKEED